MGTMHLQLQLLSTAPPPPLYSPMASLSLLTLLLLFLLAPSMASNLSTPPPPTASDGHVFFTLAAALSLSAFLLLLLSRRPNGFKRQKLPPGPPGWPLVGNLLQFSRSGKPFMHYVRDLIPVYGPIFTLRMGQRTLIVISSNELAHEALIERGHLFASRPHETPTRAVFSCNKFTVNAALHGGVWRSLRRNMVYNMLSNSRLREFRDVRDLAVDHLVHRLLSESSAADGAVRVLPNVRFAIFSILLTMCFGVEMDDATVENVEQLMKRVLIAINPRLDDYLPLLSPLFAKQRKQAMEVREDQIRTLVPLIERRRSEIQKPDPAKPSRSFAYVDTLFDLKIDGRNSSPNHAELVTLCSEFLNGGTDTTATGIEWAIARLVDEPEIQSKLYQDIVSVVGDRNVSEKDVEQMPYLNAFTKELLRKHPPTYFSLTHAVVEPTKLAGYDIPADVNVDFYLPTMAENPKCWSESTRFMPERFLSGEDADITCGSEVRMMPFGAGRRICPGLGMGLVHINLILARMVHAFEWLAHPSQIPISFNEKVEFTVVMETPLQAIIRPRNRPVSTA